MKLLLISRIWLDGFIIPGDLPEYRRYMSSSSSYYNVLDRYYIIYDWWDIVKYLDIQGLTSRYKDSIRNI